MRTEKEMFKLILSVAEKDERVRVVGMNGSRTNPNVPKDNFQDYDVVYVVTDMQSFIDNPLWIDVFGKRIILQMPEAMAMFPPELGNWFSYLMLFEDETRIDLILVPLAELNKYLQNDKLIKILLDKDNRVPLLPLSTDKDYWVKQPAPAYFDDCCNEFWWVSTYVVKGLCRDELPYAIGYLSNMRNLLFTMLSWQVGIEINFSASMGKNFKYLKNYLSANEYQKVMVTYRNDTKEHIWNSFWKCCELFRNAARDISKQMEFKYPEYDEKVTCYLHKKYKENKGTAPFFIREYRSSDCKELIQLFYDTVHTVNAKDYSKEQINAWTTGNEDCDKWDASFLSHDTLVAVWEDKIVGFGDIDSTGYLVRLYVHKDFQGRGVATSLCDRLEELIEGNIATHSSITAKAFFERRGYKILAEQKIERSGVCLTNFLMEKKK